jgi:hypothetical protein
VNSDHSQSDSISVIPTPRRPLQRLRLHLEYSVQSICFSFQACPQQGEGGHTYSKSSVKCGHSYYSVRVQCSALPRYFLCSQGSRDSGAGGRRTDDGRRTTDASVVRVLLLWSSWLSPTAYSMGMGFGFGFGFGDPCHLVYGGRVQYCRRSFIEQSPPAFDS